MVNIKLDNTTNQRTHDAYCTSVFFFRKSCSYASPNLGALSSRIPGNIPIVSKLWSVLILPSFLYFESFVHCLIHDILSSNRHNSRRDNVIDRKFIPRPCLTVSHSKHGLSSHSFGHNVRCIHSSNFVTSFDGCRYRRYADGSCILRRELSDVLSTRLYARSRRV